MTTKAYQHNQPCTRPDPRVPSLTALKNGTYQVEGLPSKLPAGAAPSPQLLKV
jgi:hypothetical protein